MHTEFFNSIAELDAILNLVGKDELNHLTLEPIASKQEFEENLARLSVLVSPSYFPFSRDDSGIYAFHLEPDTTLILSSIVYIPTESQASIFVCENLKTFPISIMLWVSRYFSKRKDMLRPIIERMISKIPGSTTLTDDLWENITFETCRWSARNRYSNSIWDMAGIHHPFAGVPYIDSTTAPKDAFDLLKDYFNRRKKIVEVLATKIALQTEMGVLPDKEDVHSVLKEESWRYTESPIFGFWRNRGKGIEDWDSTLKSLPSPEEYLSDTPFEILINDLNAYSGDNAKGPELLTQVGDKYFEMKEFQTSLNQYRNAATLYLLVKGKYPDSLGKKIIQVCYMIDPNSLSEEIVEYTLQVRHQGP